MQSRWIEKCVSVDFCKRYNLGYVSELVKCSDSPCLHGTCGDSASGFVCHCGKGYTGLDCGKYEDFIQYHTFYISSSRLYYGLIRKKHPSLRFWHHYSIFNFISKIAQQNWPCNNVIISLFNFIKWRDRLCFSKSNT